MKITKILVALLLPVLAFVYVTWGGNSAFANTGKGSNAHHSTSSAGITNNSSAGDPRTPKAAMTEITRHEGASVIYAPRDTVDMTRLVLEATRDQSMHTNHLIERATQVIVVLFAVLGSIAGLLGIHSVSDLRKKTQTLEERSVTIEGKAANLEKTSLKIEKEALDKFHEMDESMKKLGFAVIEISAGRLAIDQAKAYLDESTASTKKQLISDLLNRGVNQIENALKTYDSQLGTFAKLRAFMDLGFAKKRLDRFSDAFNEAVKALALLDSDATIPNLKNRKATFHYNAACYACLASMDTKLVINHLKMAFELDPTLNTPARENDTDFASLKNNDEFKSLFVR